jgi:hypothetical protein
MGCGNEVISKTLTALSRACFASLAMTVQANSSELLQPAQAVRTDNGVRTDRDRNPGRGGRFFLDQR